MIRPDALADLFRVLGRPAELPQWGPLRWEGVIRLARSSSLLAGLHGRLEAAGRLAAVPPEVLAHLQSGARAARHVRQMAVWELAELQALLADFRKPVVVLKGGAYVLQGLPLARQRYLSDIDLMVAPCDLRVSEAWLRAAGYQQIQLGPHDERYYRDWSHEVPPLRYPGRPLEVDLHHAITPHTGRHRIDSELLIAASVPIDSGPFRVLSPPDQVLHACLHCFNDGDLALRVREVLDIDGMLRQFGSEPGFWAQLKARARQLAVDRPLFYALRYARAWFAAPVPAGFDDDLPPPPRLQLALMDRLVPLAMWPSDPDRLPPLAARLARVAMLTRYHCLRLPLRLLVPHLVRKSLRRLASGSSSAA